MPEDEKTESSADMPGVSPDKPIYHETEVIDHLVAIVLELGAELSISRDRLARLEEMLATGAPVTLEALEQGRPSEQLTAKLAEERQAFIKRVYGRLYSGSGGDQESGKSAL